MRYAPEGSEISIESAVVGRGSQKRSATVTSAFTIPVVYALFPLIVVMTSTVLVRGELIRVVLTAAFVFGWTQIVGPCGTAHVGGLTPVWHGSTKRLWGCAVLSYTLAGMASAAIVGGLLGTIGDLVPASTVLISSVLLMGISILFILRDLNVGSLPLPQIRRQTRWKWFAYRPVYANSTLWGFDVGLVFATWITFSGAWLLAIVAIGLGSPMLGALVFIVYWLGRVAPHWIDPLLMPDPAATPLYMKRVLDQFNTMRLVHVITMGWAAIMLVWI